MENTANLQEINSELVFVRDGAAFTDSRIVADKFGKQHGHVLQAIDQVIDNIGNQKVASLMFQEVMEFDEKANRAIRHFVMNRDGYMLVVMGFNGKEAMAIKLKFIEAFNRMEDELLKPAHPKIDLWDPKSLRKLLADSSEVIEKQQETINAMQPSVDALERIATADGSLCLRETAKALQMQEKRFVALMLQHRWLFRQHGSGVLLGYASRVQSGDIEHKVTTVLRADGSEKVTEQARITAQGLTKLAKLFPPLLNKA
jgi:Rha family phage regulatory protein